MNAPSPTNAAQSSRVSLMAQTFHLGPAVKVILTPPLHIFL
jgi:hypothetical protein